MSFDWKEWERQKRNEGLLNAAVQFVVLAFLIVTPIALVVIALR